MKNQNTIFIFIFFCLLSCVEEIKFQAEEDLGTLVVDGELSTIADSNFVFLFHTNKINLQIFAPEENATITLFDHLGNSEMYHDLGFGKYYVQGNEVEVKVGGIYYIEITTQDNQKYQSEPETIVDAPEIDSLTFEFSIEEIIERENRVLERSFFNLNVNGIIPEQNPQTYLKWDVKHVYQVAEITCSPLVAPRVCYVSRKINNNEVLILDGSDYTAGSIYHVPVVHQELDYAFGLVASFYVSQKSLSQSAFRYWERVKKILNNGGTIFDTPPAAISGNIHCTTTPGAEVLGYFSAIDEKKKVILITRGDFVDPFDELPLCGLNGFLPADIDFRICCYCLNLENSTRIRPSYWP